MRKSLLFGLIFLLTIGFAGITSAVSIDAPSTIPNNVSWGFSADIGFGSTATVEIDGSKVAEVFSSGDVIYKAFSPNVSNAYMFGNDLVVYHVGLSEGTHTITVNSDSKDVTAINLPNESEILASVDTKVESKLGEYDQKLSGLEADFKGFWDKLNATEAKANSLDSSVSSLSNEVSSVSSKVDSTSSSLSSTTSSFEQRIASLEGVEQQRIADEEAARLAEEEAQKNSPITGFFNLTKDLALPIAFIVIVVVLGIVAFIAKDRLPKLDSIYSPEKKDEHGLPLSKEDNEVAEEILSGGNKWAFKEEEEEEE
ncbi:MAG: hypothetical protein CL944_02865 [Candidatus Diapherotrites archaeon]|uniref:Uncharacterized protein n=1 Tax=Candidatus Iainarchaeum sp. TaxID=3101447 RepID=A0A2D6LQC4_9ARCH|nr:hypothetical protein [Candidatus Diapherotrites archaeon]|tara:strand:- start:6920 stop:7855 length:936 start_codon:yes stop_codon:yes gene_type:complete